MIIIKKVIFAIICIFMALILPFLSWFFIGFFEGSVFFIPGIILISMIIIIVYAIKLFIKAIKYENFIEDIEKKKYENNSIK